MNIALKESRETLYWLTLIARCEMIKDDKLSPIIEEGKAIRAILSSIVKKSKFNLNL